MQRPIVPVQVFFRRALFHHSVGWEHNTEKDRQEGAKCLAHSSLASLDRRSYKRKFADL